jgi:hypothetical protein
MRRPLLGIIQSVSCGWVALHGAVAGCRPIEKACSLSHLQNHKGTQRNNGRQSSWTYYLKHLIAIDISAT